MAIQVAPADADTSPLWNVVAKGLTELGLYDDAYASVMATPFEKQLVVNPCNNTSSIHHLRRKRDCASQFAIHMCEENAVDKLMSFDFSGIASEVEAALAFKARNADPRSRPCYSRILYTWYIRRGDYRNGKQRSTLASETRFVYTLQHL